MRETFAAARPGCQCGDCSWRAGGLSCSNSLWFIGGGATMEIDAKSFFILVVTLGAGGVAGYVASEHHLLRPAPPPPAPAPPPPPKETASAPAPAPPPPPAPTCDDMVGSPGTCPPP